MRIEQQYAKRYLLSGKAHATFHNTRSGNQLHFLVRNRLKDGHAVFYKGTDYIGVIHDDKFYPVRNYHGGIQPIKVFDYIWRHILTQSIPDYVHILHDGRCGKCGRRLTDAESIQLGIGPECRKKLQQVASKQIQITY